MVLVVIIFPGKKFNYFVVPLLARKQFIAHNASAVFITKVDSFAL